MQQTGLDNNGYILSEVSQENIQPEYKVLIKDCVVVLKTALPKLIHSIYVYGSVARGNPVHGKSDLDLLVIFNEKLNKRERGTLNKTLDNLSTKHKKMVREVGVADCTYGELLAPENKYGWGAYLKILCVCIDGKDLTKKFGKFKPSSEIAMGFNGDIDAVLQSALVKIKKAGTNDEAGRIAATFARKLIRTCYSMVMPRSQVWTTKLNEQAQVFLCYFPEKEPFVRTLQNWIDNPPTNRKDVFRVLDEDGRWIVDKFKEEAHSKA